MDALRNRRRRFFRYALTLFWALVVTAGVTCWLLVAGAFRPERTLSPDDQVQFVRRGPYYVSAHPNMVFQKFLAEKPRKQFRIFVLGASEIMGTPYVHQDFEQTDELFHVLRIPNRGGVATWLEEYLPQVFSDRRIRAINSAKGGRNLAASVATLRQVLQIGAPDLVVVMAGNNERAPGKRVAELTGAYRRQLASLVQLVDQARTRTVLMTVPNNLRDWAPAGQTNSAINESLRAFRNGDVDRALEILKSTAGEDFNPLRLFLLAKCFDRKKDYVRAKKYYLLARDNDQAFLRCRSVWNDLVRSTSSPCISFLDMEAVLAKYAQDSIPGSDLYHDYCHLNKRGIQIIAFELAEFIRKELRPNAKEIHLDDADPEKTMPDHPMSLYLLQQIKQWRLRLYESRLRTPAPRSSDIKQRARVAHKELELVIEYRKLLSNRWEMRDSNLSFGL